MSQLNQAIATRTQIEHYRRYLTQILQQLTHVSSYRSQLTPNGLGHTMCALYWQLNDVWAAPTWSSIDFDQRWKAAHYHVKHAFAPVSISLVRKNKRIKLRLAFSIWTEQTRFKSMLFLT